MRSVRLSSAVWESQTVAVSTNGLPLPVPPTCASSMYALTTDPSWQRPRCVDAWYDSAADETTD